MSIIGDIHEIKNDQKKILQAITDDGPIVTAIGNAAASAATAAASCNASLDVLKEIAATLTQIATVQAEMAQDLAVIKAEIIPPLPDTIPVGLVVEPGAPVER